MPKESRNYQDDDALIQQIYVTMRLFTKTLNDAIKPYDIYSSEWTIMNYLSKHEDISQSDIASALQIEPAAVSKTLGKMEKKGLVMKSSKQDKREKYIALTDKGLELLPLVSKSVLEHRNKALGELSEKNRGNMRQLMLKVLNNLKEI